jgi:hypothetical protein
MMPERRQVTGLVVLLASILTGSSACGAGTAAERTQADQEHEHAAPHGGLLVELGDEFAHVELVLDRREGALTAYVLDEEAEQPIRLSQPAIDATLDPAVGVVALSLNPIGSVLTGESSGNTSQFAIRHHALQTNGAIAGRLKRIQVRGREFHDVPFAIAAETGKRP